MVWWSMVTVGVVLEPRAWEEVEHNEMEGDGGEESGWRSADAMLLL